LYNGNPAYENYCSKSGPSFIRLEVLNFAAREDHENLKLLTDYTIKHHFPQIQKEGIKNTFFFKKLLKPRSI
jgi:uncharacterized protein YdiU (UPF0061 family)